jgi:hypothetical protein
MTTAISAPINAYSIAVTPDSSAQKEIASCRHFICGFPLCRRSVVRHRLKGERGGAVDRAPAVHQQRRDIVA